MKGKAHVHQGVHHDAGHHSYHHVGHFGHTHGTHHAIEKHIRKHRAAGGKAESPEHGDDDAEKDLKENPAEYNKGKPEAEAEQMHAKKGGKMKSKKCGMKAGGHAARHHSGRRHRASGGGCESNPFTHALKGTGPRENKVERETKGEND